MQERKPGTPQEASNIAKWLGVHLPAYDPIDPRGSSTTAPAFWFKRLLCLVFRPICAAGFARSVAPCSLIFLVPRPAVAFDKGYRG